MGDLLLDLLLPKTDRTVAIQWIVATVVWITAIWLVRKQDRDIRHFVCLLYTSPSPRDGLLSRMPSSA